MNKLRIDGTSPDNGIIVIGQAGNPLIVAHVICYSEDGKPSEKEMELARVISAAPDLYAACAAMIANIDEWLETGKPSNKAASKKLYDAMAEALKKAKGEK